MPVREYARRACRSCKRSCKRPVNAVLSFSSRPRGRAGKYQAPESDHESQKAHRLAEILRMGVQSEYYVALMWRVKSISLRGKSAPKNARQPRSRAASRALPPARTHAHARPPALAAPGPGVAPLASYTARFKPRRSRTRSTFQKYLNTRALCPPSLLPSPPAPPSPSTRRAKAAKHTTFARRPTGSSTDATARARAPATSARSRATSCPASSALSHRSR